MFDSCRNCSALQEGPRKRFKTVLTTLNRDCRKPQRIAAPRSGANTRWNQKALGRSAKSAPQRGRQPQHAARGEAATASAAQRGRQPQHAARREAASASAASRMSSSDSSGIRTWGPQNGGYNLDSMSDASDWSPSPRPSSSHSPVFEQPRYGPSSRQPYGRGNQHGGNSVDRPKSGSTSRNPDYRDGQPAVRKRALPQARPSSSSVGSPTSVLENAGVPISAPPKTRSKPWSRRPWSSVKGAPNSAPESAGVPTSTPTWRSVRRTSTQPQSQPVKFGDRHPTNRDGGVEGLGRGDGSVGGEAQQRRSRP